MGRRSMPDDNCSTNSAGSVRRRASRFVPLLLGGASAAAIVAVGLTAPVAAQSAAATDELDEIVVTGIRKSLRESADIKRRSQGVVDGIVAEDMGKFPDSNLAESLQRIAGVSISRQGGEGSQVTVRGFGPGFNQVTLNGRSLPTADIPYVGGDAGGNSVGANSRAFDFSNLASEGVRALQVYKTGRANIASGGIGATINIETRKPIDEAGLRGSIGAKVAHDSGVDAGNKFTPEFAGYVGWSDDDQKFGIGLFGSYSRRDSGSASVNSAAWNVETAGTFLNPANGRVTATTQITNAPTDPNALISVPRDSRYFFSDITRERINGQAVMQFNPTEKLRITTDYTFYTNEAREDRASVSNWFNRPYSQVVFDSNPAVATTTFLQEDLNGVKDLAMLQTLRQTRDEMDSFGINVEYDVLDNVTFKLDAHSSKAKVSPNAPFGYSQIEVGMAMPVVTSHSVDYSGEVPIINITRDDSIASNGDGVYDVDDISTQVANHDVRRQENKIDQFDFQGQWDIDEDYTLTAGVNYRSQSNTTQIDQDRQILGNWGANNPGDVEQYAPGALEEFCISCQYKDFNVTDINSFRGDAGAIFAAVTDVYAAQGNPIISQGQALDTIEEDVLALYAQFDGNTEVSGMAVRFSAGLRFEETDVTAFTTTAPITAIDWSGDNDFSVVAASGGSGFSSSSTYRNWLPNLDVAVDLTDDIVTRLSYSRTMARAGYGNLFASDTVNRPAGPTANGFVPTGSKGNPGLLPLVSDNFDFSVEWYYGDDSWVSVGAFKKNVKNFVGIGQTTSSLFNLQDVTSGAAGTLSGNALASLANVGANVSDQNLFAMAFLLNQNGNAAAAEAAFSAEFDAATGGLNNAFYTALEAAAGNSPLTASSNDPEYQFQVTQPVNNKESSLKGLEISAQHFFGDTGFGVAASYTYVDGDVAFDNGGSTAVDQFALTGLSDTANVTLIYENYGFSARAAYNWREGFLASTNRGGGFRNPVYIRSFKTFDLNVSYEVTEDIAVSFEAINITGESSRDYGRDKTNLWFARENSPRYFLGARYKF